MLQSKQSLGYPEHRGNSILEELNIYSLVMGTITREEMIVYKYLDSLEGVKMREIEELFGGELKGK